MSTIATMAVALAANYAGFEQGMRASGNAVRGLGSEFASAKSLIEQTREPTERFNQQTDALVKALDQGKISFEHFERAADAARQQLKQSEEAAKESTSAFGGFAEKVIEFAAGGELVKGMFEQLESGLERIGEIGRGATRLGISPEEYSKLAFAADSLRIPVQGLEGDFFRLQSAVERAAEGDKAVGKVFEQLHLDATQLRDENPMQLFREVADAIANMDNVAERAQAVRELFGRGGAELLPLLKEGSEGFEKLTAQAGIVTESQVAVAEETERTVAAWKNSWHTAIQDVAADLVENWARMFGEGPVEKAAVSQAQALKKAQDHVRELATQSQGGFGGNLDQNIAAHQRLIDALKHEADLAKDAANGDSLVGGGVFRTAEAQLRAEQKKLEALEKQRDALDDVVDAVNEEADAEARLHELVIATADADYNASAKKAGKEYDDFIKQQKELDKLQDKFEPHPEQRKFIEDIADLGKLLDAGRISVEKYRDELSKLSSATDQIANKRTAEQKKNLEENLSWFMFGVSAEDAKKLGLLGEDQGRRGRGSEREQSALSYDPRLIDPRGLQNHQAKVENHLAQIAKNTTPKKNAPGQRA